MDRTVINLVRTYSDHLRCSVLDFNFVLLRNNGDLEAIEIEYQGKISAFLTHVKLRSGWAKSFLPFCPEPNLLYTFDGALMGRPGDLRV